MRRKRPPASPPPLRISAICLAGDRAANLTFDGQRMQPDQLMRTLLRDDIKNTWLDLWRRQDGRCPPASSRNPCAWASSPSLAAERYASEYETGRARRLGPETHDPLLGGKARNGAQQETQPTSSSRATVRPTLPPGYKSF